MKRQPTNGDSQLLKLWFQFLRWWVLAAVPAGLAATAGAGQTESVTNEIRIVALEGDVQILAPGASTWIGITSTNQAPLQASARLRTGPNSRAFLNQTTEGIITVDARTEIEVLAPHQPDAQPGLRLFQGIFSFFHRGKPGHIRVIAGGALAGIEGTEFVVKTLGPAGAQRTTLSVVDGRVRFENTHGFLILTNRQEAIAQPDQRPVLTSGFQANNLLQWCFYYPAVLDLQDLRLSPDEQSGLSQSLIAYRSGDLLNALRLYPTNPASPSAAAKLYQAALLLCVGQVDWVQSSLPTQPSAQNQPLANGLLTLIAAVKREPDAPTFSPQTSTEYLALSYLEQSRAVPKVSLVSALAMARRAALLSPQFGFAWARVAELEFSFGHIRSANEALDQALLFSPRNAQALSLKGFLLAAQNKTGEALDCFQQALAIDPALGNAWLGRGLIRIRRGDLRAGREDLLMAAAVEPQRGALRSYLAKAWIQSGDSDHALKELQLAKALDPNDPTAWLYSALWNEQRNQLNAAIGDLERSQQLNDNRTVYRSQLLLDQDRAVRSANLARIYQEAGMNEVSLREAVSAVSADEANYSAHLFLANSYNALEDPHQINLRYETPAQTEYLVANLLAPSGAGILSSAVTQQEYSRLFDQDRFEVHSATVYSSRGAWTQSGSQSGTFGDTSFLLGASYTSSPGERINNDFESVALSYQLKQQLSAQDSIYFQVSRNDTKGGDVYEYFDPGTQSNPGLRTQELQEPYLALGYHREWQPGIHTLILAGYLKDTYQVSNPNWQGLRLDYSNNIPYLAQRLMADQNYQNSIALYSLEAQQIWETPQQATIVGALFQAADLRTDNLIQLPFPNGSVYNDPPADQRVENSFRRISLYGYHRRQITDQLRFVLGVTYDNLLDPKNFRSAPVSAGSSTLSEFSPKLGVVWDPMSNTVVRAAWTRSVAGASLDQSQRLEPTEVAGFNQSFRSLIPESVVGSTSGTKFETMGLSLEQKFFTGTYLGLSAEILKSKVNQTIGDFALSNQFAEISSTREHLAYQESSLNFTLDQLVGPWTTLGLRYRLSQVKLQDNLTELGPSIRTVSGFEIYPRSTAHATLQQLTLQAVINHPSGFWTGLYGSWYGQRNADTQAPGNANFWQVNWLAGYRLAPHRRMEVQCGILNLTGRDYRLNPLNLYNEFPHSRTFVTQLQVNF